MACPLGCQGTVLAHAELLSLALQGPFLLSCSQPIISQPLLVSDIAPSQLSSPHFPLLNERPAVADCPVLQYIQIPLRGLSSLQGVCSTSHFNVISELTEDTFHSNIQRFK